LRFGAARDRLGADLLKNPTIWQYAKKAGFRTVYIDAQAGFNRNPGKLQNFMTADEVAQIDAFHAIDEDVAPSDADDRLLDIVVKEMKSDNPVFIYANKNGAHFPYDRGYPANAKIDRPTMSDGPDQSQARINSFRNVVRWSVDRFFGRMMAEAPLANSVVIYTSDHGQIFDPRRLTHCTVDDPDPREGLVPLFVMPGNTGLRPRFEAAAQASHGHGSHFAIIPTVLELFGYSRADVAAQYGESLFEPNKRAPAFTSGDIFGLFAKTVRWHPLDLRKDYLEPAARPLDLRSDAARAGTTGVLAR
jgi:lipid A ethanolaminephosphotransferase